MIILYERDIVIESDKDLLIAKLEEEIAILKGNKSLENKICYNFSEMTDTKLESIVNIKQILFKRDIFDSWFRFDYSITDEESNFLNNLLLRNIDLINLYHEEDLKINFIAPLIDKINFFLFEDEIRNFYNERLKYETDNFILNGEVDFLISKGLKKADKPYFFIQEFKRGEKYSNPRPQLLAELIVAIELNKWSSVKGAYVIGENWNFVILEKLEKYKYQYFVSNTFNSSKIEDLKAIFKNLQFIKNEILKLNKEGK